MSVDWFVADMSKNHHASQGASKYMKDFQHVILTRFNVRVNYSPSRLGINPEWLTHRFGLFEQFCYPSVLKQTNQDFKWLVFFDSETPQFFKDKIETYAKWKNFIPVYFDHLLTGKDIRQFLLNILQQETRYLITTRLDNDDAISKHLIEKVQAEFQGQAFEFINFTNGYVLSDGKLYLLKYKANPFASLIEKITEFTPDGFKAVLSITHDRLGSSDKVRQINTQPTWLQVVHGRNISNRVRGIRQPITNLTEDFSIQPDRLPIKDNFLPYWVDRSFGLLKYPLESAILDLPKDTRTFLKKIVLRR